MMRDVIPQFHRRQHVFRGEAGDDAMLASHGQDSAVSAELCFEAFKPHVLMDRVGPDPPVPSFLKSGSGKASSNRTCWAASLKHKTRDFDLKLKSIVATSAKTRPSSRIQSTYSFSETLGTSLRLNHNVFVRTADIFVFGLCLRSFVGKGWRWRGEERRRVFGRLSHSVQFYMGRKKVWRCPGPNRDAQVPSDDVTDWAVWLNSICKFLWVSILKLGL